MVAEELEGYEASSPRDIGRPPNAPTSAAGAANSRGCDWWLRRGVLRTPLVAAALIHSPGELWRACHWRAKAMRRPVAGWL
jgi:hypothetical protein